MNAKELIDECDLRTGKVLTRYVKGNLLGKGGFAKCYEVTEQSTGRQFAVKILDKETLKKPKTQQKLKSEIKIHSSLRHSHIVKFEKCFEDYRNVYIILELCTQQTLMELQKRKKRLTEEEVAYFLMQIIYGVKYMHQQNIIHRDLKLGNLLLNEKMEIKIGDFGLATQVEFDGERKLTVCGTPNYIAPEVLDGGKQGHSFEVDIWSLGVILYTLLVGKPPFETSDVKTTYRNIRTLNYSFPEGVEISPSAKGLIQRILQSQPEHRPLLSDIENDVWFQQTKVSKTAPFSLFPYSATTTPAPTLPMVHEPRDRDREPVKALKRMDSLGAPATREPLRPLNIICDGPSRPSPRFASASPRFRQQPASATVAASKANAENVRYNQQQVPWQDRANAESPAASAGVLPPSKAGPFHDRPQSARSASPAPPAAAGLDCRTGKECRQLNEPTVSRPLLVPADVLPQSVDTPMTPTSTSRMGCANVWVTEYSDFSAKYGLAYKLSCGFTGAVFNDSTKMIWDDSTGRVEYYARSLEKDPASGSSSSRSAEERFVCTVTEYPETLKKKITLIMYFRSYFAKYKGKSGAAYPIISANLQICESCAENGGIAPHRKEDLVYVRQWMTDDLAVIFRLSNRCYQVSFFDGTNLLMNSEQKMVTVSEAGKARVLSLHAGKFASLEKADVAEKLEYMQKLLHQFVHKA